jgi:glycosyltransferase involved in cell wall biosynthesis
VRVLLVQPQLDPPGGGNLVAAWILQALRDEHELSLLAWRAPDLPACNRHYGTSLRDGDFTLHLVPTAARALARLSPTPAGLLKDAYLMRRSRRLAARHDVVIGCNNEADFGRPGIQYVHYPKLAMVRPSVDVRWYHASRGVMTLYYRAAARLARFSAVRMKANLTLANSAYMAATLRALHGIEPVVLNPPVPGEFPSVPWEERENGFVCVGRLSREKRVDTIVEILHRVRAGGDDVTLHVAGLPDDRGHVRLLRRLAREHSAWIRLYLDLSRPDLIDLVARQRYGIHAMLGEPFGIAVAEMMRAGAIPFVPGDAGPAEIVGGEPSLCWSDVDDAVAKIRAVLRDPERQASLRRRMQERALLHSSERFCTELRTLVRDFARPA